MSAFNIKTLALLLACGVALTANTAPVATSALEIHVSPEGNDAHDGSAQSPVASLGAALQRVRAARAKSGINGAIITLHQGVYFLDRSIELQAADSGSANAPLRIQAKAGEQVLLHGGRRLEARRVVKETDAQVLARVSAEARANIWRVDLKACGISDYGTLKQHGFGTPVAPAEMELVVDGKPWHLARYPNAGQEQLKIGRVQDKGSVPRNGDKSNRGAVFGYEYDRAERWRAADDLWLHGRFSFGYADDHLKVASIDSAAKMFHLAQPHLYGVMSSLYPNMKRWEEREGTSIRGYYAYNLLEELDAPEEYYLDRRRGVLYLYGATMPVQGSLDLSVLESPLLSLRGVTHLTISGLTFVSGRGLGIYQADTHHVTIEGCSFRHLGTAAVSMGQRLQPAGPAYNADGSPKIEVTDSESFHDNVIANCIIAHNGTCGVIVAGGDRRKLVPSGNVVRNCEFFANSRRNTTYAPSVRLLGVGHQVRECYFHDQRHESLAFNGNDFIIEQNVFVRVCRDTDDMGAIYTGRDPSQRGTLIRQNFFSDVLPPDHDSKMCAIYVDDGSGGITVEQNIFCRAGNPGKNLGFGAAFFHGGHDNAVRENFFVDCPKAAGHAAWNEQRWKDYLKSSMMQQRLTKDVDIYSPVYQKAYPALARFLENPRPRTNELRGNLLYATPLGSNGQWVSQDNVTIAQQRGSLDPTTWTLPIIQQRFGGQPLVKKILAKPMGLNLAEFRRWHPTGPEGQDEQSVPFANH